MSAWSERAIGVFDSGVGGLTVLRALREHLPEEDFLYLGDTARLPYGTKGADTVTRYACQAAQLLVDRGVKLLVIACNTASAVALPELTRRFAPLPVVGVVEPGAQAACQAPSQGAILVCATAGTIRGQAYEKAIAAVDPTRVVRGVACPVFVCLAEEGWGDSDIAQAVASRYLEPFFAAGSQSPPVGTLVLGCTHFPVLREAISRSLGAFGVTGISIVDSAGTTAEVVRQRLQQRHLTSKQEKAGCVRYLATDAVDRFCAAARPFLGAQLEPAQVQWVDLG